MQRQKKTGKKSKKGKVNSPRKAMSVAAASKEFDRAAKSLAKALKARPRVPRGSARPAAVMLASAAGARAAAQEFLSDLELIGKVAGTQAERQASRSRAISTWYELDWGTFAREEGGVPGWSLSRFSS